VDERCGRELRGCVYIGRGRGQKRLRNWFGIDGRANENQMQREQICKVQAADDERRYGFHVFTSRQCRSCQKLGQLLLHASANRCSQSRLVGRAFMLPDRWPRCPGAAPETQRRHLDELIRAVAPPHDLGLSLYFTAARPPKTASKSTITLATFTRDTKALGPSTVCLTNWHHPARA
jgi:hypothetical protein